MGGGNDGWDNSDGGDGLKEPLLDVGSFAATTVATSGGGTEPPNTAPVVIITSPSDASTYATTAGMVTFAGTADDAVDGDLTGFLAWTVDSTSYGLAIPSRST